MIYAILDRLKNDTELKSLLNSTDDDSKIYPLFTTSNDTCLVYTDAPVTGGDIKENRLEIRIITDDYDKLNQIEKCLNRLLDIKEYEQGFRFNNISILKSSLSGGGTLEHSDTKQIERILIYQIKWKER
ncbi:hypothetical protein [Clostridium thermosuccinogenes]|uniref:hypothetical protein n=1 Tax=Clostridium thermosuccinogenes TaxID=84032 RepID=UPI000CCC7540|nr:hypothetical protein [Pseudoclostridium thermosuccinogenes]PNT94149.1 hypothetical protein CDQ83_11920 [Pseudoclostridium thermosuccinogenes]